MAQNPPDPPDGHGETEDQGPGGNAPIGAGTLLLIGLVLCMAAKEYMN